MNRYFVDTNLLLYSVDPRAPEKRQRAKSWLESLWTTGAGCISWQVLHEFYWNAVRKMGLDVALGRDTVTELLAWVPVDTTPSLIRQAWEWTDMAGLAYWDALIVAAAERCGAEYLLTEDLQAGRRFGGVEVVNPFEPGTYDRLAPTALPSRPS